MKPLPVEASERLFLVEGILELPTGELLARPAHVYPDYVAIRDSAAFEGLAAGGPQALLVTEVGATPQRRIVFFASHDFFTTLGVRLSLGRGFTSGDDRRGHHPAHEDPAVRLERRFKAFNQAFGEFVRAVDDRSPFYTEAIYQELSAAIQVARREEMGVRLHRPEEPDWYENGRRNSTEFVERAETISRLIRERLASLPVA